MPDRQSGRSSGVEHNLAKVGVEGSNPFARSSFLRKINGLENHFPAGGVNFPVFGSCSDFRENVRIASPLQFFNALGDSVFATQSGTSVNAPIAVATPTDWA